MATDFDKSNFGDCARNRLCELNYKNSNHVFDGAGENIQYHSDSESLGSRKSKTRYINPAIYVEPIESTHSTTSLLTEESSSVDDITPHPHSSYRSNSTPFLTGRVNVSSGSSGSVRRKSCRLKDDCAPGKQLEEDATPRCERIYQENGQDTFRLSVASISTTTTTKEDRERNEERKKEAFKQWLARKEQEKRDKARLEKMKCQTSPSRTAQKREESYRRWLECKRTQSERRKADEIMQQYRDNERLERERRKRESDKDKKLSEWVRKKEEEMKVMKTREERRAARASIEAEKRRVNNDRAYRDWLRTSKNKPLPVPLNQGELSMRGSVSEMYINPIPWQSPAGVDTS